MIRCLFTLAVLFLFSCKKESFEKVEVIGHAGAGLQMSRMPFIGNTQGSLDFAHQLGASYVEIDLQLTQDYRWVLFHDDYLEETTELTGCVHEHALEVLEKTRYHGFSNDKILSLEASKLEAFDRVYLDIRHYFPCDNYAIIDTNQLNQALGELTSKFPSGTAVIVNRNASVLTYFQQKGFLVAQEVEHFDSMLESASLYGFNHFWIRNSWIEADEVAQGKQLGFNIALTHIRSHAANKDAMRKMPNFVVTDAVSSALGLKLP